MVSDELFVLRPIQYVVSSHEVQTVPPIAGFLVFLVSVAAQFMIGRRLKINQKINYIAAGILMCSFFVPGWKELPRSLRVAPVLNVHDWVAGIVTLWALCMIAAACVLILWDRVPAANRSRRRFLQAAGVGLCAAPAAVFGFGIITRKDFNVNEIDLVFPNLAKDLHGLRCLQLSDIHLGAFYSPQDLERVIDASNQLRADIAFITGDLITTRYDPLDTCLRQIRRLRTTSGIWGCMGNHERYSHVEAYTQQQAKLLDIAFLRRESTSLRFGSSRLNLVGVDFEPKGPYLSGVEDLVDLDSFNLLLAHTPEVFPTAAEKGFDLTLSGHTHGGQINLELFGADINVADVRTPYTKGLYSLPTSKIYVNSGLGTIGVPVRIGAPAEITLIRLCAS